MSSAIAAQQLQVQDQQCRNRDTPRTSAEPEQGAFRLRQVVVVVQRQSRIALGQAWAGFGRSRKIDLIFDACEETLRRKKIRISRERPLKQSLRF